MGPGNWPSKAPKIHLRYSDNGPTLCGRPAFITDVIVAEGSHYSFIRTVCVLCWRATRKAARIKADQEAKALGQRRSR